MNWIQQQLQVCIYPNYTIEECQQRLQKTKLRLSDYLLVCVGKKNGQKHAAFFHLQNSKEFQGKHTILIYTSENLITPFEIYVDSFSHFRQHILKYEDRLSFERSTFVIVYESQCFIRLKCLRGILEYYTPSIPINHQNNLCTTNRTFFQLQRNLEQIFTAYVRDLETRGIPKETICYVLRQDVLLFLDKMILYLNN